MVGEVIAYMLGRDAGRRKERRRNREVARYTVTHRSSFMTVLEVDTPGVPLFEATGKDEDDAVQNARLALRRIGVMDGPYSRRR